MSEDRSLDEFFDSSDDQSESDDDERATETAAAVDDTDADTDTAVEGVAHTDLTDTDSESLSDEGDETAIDQPRPTYRWSPDGEDCPVCGRSTNTQWHDGGRFVCADCKEW